MIFRWTKSILERTSHDLNAQLGFQANDGFPLRWDPRGCDQWRGILAVCASCKAGRIRSRRYQHLGILEWAWKQLSLWNLVKGEDSSVRSSFTHLEFLKRRPETCRRCLNQVWLNGQNLQLGYLQLDLLLLWLHSALLQTAFDSSRAENEERHSFTHQDCFWPLVHRLDFPVDTCKEKMCVYIYMYIYIYILYIYIYIHHIHHIYKYAVSRR